MADMPSPYPIIFEPLAMERIWGGRSFESLFGKHIPPGAPIGELWEIVDREDAQSVVHSGPLRGEVLHDLWTRRREEVFGADYSAHPAPRFPLLIKLLDARETLSVQVHPPERLAASMGGEPKTEMWYFAHAKPGAVIYAGLDSGVTKDLFEAALRAGHVEKILHSATVQAGDSIFIPSGRIHAIGAGCVIVEVQQNSDTTYRVFDWNRTGLDGQPRKLHIEESLASTDFEDFEPAVDRVEAGTVAHCPFFHVEKLRLSTPVSGTDQGRFAIIAVLAGEVLCGGESYFPGAFFLVPASFENARIEPKAPGTEALKITLPIA